MLVSAVQTRIKRQFGDESGVQVTDADIIRWINDGCRQIVMQNEGLLEKIGTASTVADQQDYTLPTDLLILRSIQYKTSGVNSYFKLKGMSLQEFDEYVDGWNGTEFPAGVPTTYTVYAGLIKVFPIPDTTIANAFKLFYNRTPVDVTTAADTPDLPVIYHESLVKYCLQQAYEMDEDWEAVSNKTAELNSDISLLRGRSDWKRQDYYPTITVLMEDWD